MIPDVYKIDVKKLIYYIIHIFKKYIFSYHICKYIEYIYLWYKIVKLIKSCQHFLSA